MRTLNFYEVGVDPLPVNGSTIYMFDKTRSFNMFETQTTVCGVVQYTYNEFGDTLEDALAKGVKLCIDGEEYDKDYKLVGVSINLDTSSDVYILRRGMIWYYEHEYLTMLDDSVFPFQCRESFDHAVKNKIITIEHTTEVKPQLTPNQIASEIESIVYTMYVVLYGKQRLNIKFITINGETYLREYYVYE